MHWTDPFNDRVKFANRYALSGSRLIRALISDGWTPEEIAFFASEEFAVKREIFRDAILRVHAKNTKGETHEV